MTYGPATLLAFDFDGTLAPIRRDPNEVKIHPGAAVLLAQTTSVRGLTVAIVSGRDAEDLTQRVRTPAAYIIGSHGLEIRAPGGVVVRDAPPFQTEVPGALSREIKRQGMRLEQKKHAIALHWRGLDESRCAPVIDRFIEWASGADLAVIHGRCVVEARCRGGEKKEALRWLASAVGASRVIYAGDDVTDFPALQFAAGRGRGVFVASTERAAPEGVTVVKSFRELFHLVREEVMI